MKTNRALFGLLILLSQQAIAGEYNQLYEGHLRLQDGICSYPNHEALFGLDSKEFPRFDAYVSVAGSYLWNRATFTIREEPGHTAGGTHYWIHVPLAERYAQIGSCPELWVKVLY